MTDTDLKRARHVALLYAAADAHEDWEVLVGPDGVPEGVRRQNPDSDINTARELAEWFVDAFPEEAERILTAELKTLH